MYRTLCLMLAFVAVVATAAVTHSEVTTLSGTIQKMDVGAGRLTLRSAEGTLTELEAPPGLLTRLHTGDTVEVMMAGPNAMIIRRQDDDSAPARAETPSQPQSRQSRDRP